MRATVHFKLPRFRPSRRFIPHLMTTTPLCLPRSPCPHELVEHILLLLDTESMLACRLVNRRFNEIIQTSTALQYFLACKAAGVIDNPQSRLSYTERLDALKKREDAWRKLKPVCETTISVIPERGRQICRPMEGVCFVNGQKDLVYCHLTSFPQDKPQWISMPAQGPALNLSGVLVDLATALYEHDLIVNFISSNVENQANMQQLDSVLLKFSNGEYHPLARHPRIHVQKFPDSMIQVASRVVGDNLAFIVRGFFGTFFEKLFIFDWKTGRKRLQHEADEVSAYFNLVFVSPELLLVPNVALLHFEVWHLPPHQFNPKPPIQILSLRMPTFSSPHELMCDGCYGEPHPFLHSMPYLPQPFFSSPENSIIVVNFRSNQNGCYDFILHRCRLLDTIQTWTSPSLLEQQEELPTWLTNELTAHHIADPEDGSVELEAQSKLISAFPHPKFSPRTRDSPTFSRHFPTPLVPTDSGSSYVPSGLSTNSSTSRYTFLQVPWAKWGPSISRWFQVNKTPLRWFSHSSGQRYLFSDPNPLDGKRSMVSVADFNLHNFRRNAEIMARLRSGECEDNSCNDNNEKGKEEEEEDELEILDHKGAFSEEVYMGLKCVVYRAPDEYDCDTVLMDERRLLGMKMNSMRQVESIKVLYIA